MADHSHDLVVLTTASNEGDAKLITEVLEDEGIHATVDGEFASGFLADAPMTVRVLVGKEDEERAKETLQRIRDEDDRIDWSKVDVGEPED